MKTIINPFPIQTADGTIYGLYLPNGNVQINKGSFFRSFDVPSLKQNYRNIRTYLINNGYVDIEKGTMIKNYVFNSPSEAICCLIGGMESGNRKFYTVDNIELGVFLSVDDEPIRREALEEDEMEITLSSNDVDDSIPTVIYEPVQKPDYIEKNGGSFARNPVISKNAIKLASFKCELNHNHETFVTNADKPYVEAHHLIPLSCQRDFKYSLDVEANVVCLCPNCHRKLHYGKDIIKELKILFDSRIEKLNQCGIDITFEKLVEYYKV